MVAAGGTTLVRLPTTMLLASGDFYELQDFAASQNRDGFLLTIPISTTWQPQQWLSVRGGYGLNRYVPDAGGSPWGFWGHRLHVGAQLDPLQWLAFYGEAALYRRNYRNRFTTTDGNLRDRKDTEWQVDVGLDLHFGENGRAFVGYTGSFQNSLALFDYTRHIVTAGLGGSF